MKAVVARLWRLLHAVIGCHRYDSFGIGYLRCKDCGKVWDGTEV